jgi:hypothetical protein
VDAEPLVVPSLWTGVGQQVGEPFLAFGGQFVDTFGAAAPRAVLVRLFLGDEPGAE